MTWLRALCIALSTYSKIPVPQVEWNERNLRYSLCFFPVVGAVIGAVMWGWFRICDALALGAMMRGVVGALIPVAVSGGIHMDGLMDTMDALGSRASRERKLQILKDSHVGAFGALGCAAYLVLTAGILSEAKGPVVFMVFVLSRAASALALVSMTSASAGLLKAFSDSAARRAVRWAAAGFLLVFSALASALALPVALAVICTLALCWVWLWRMSMREFGGITGDLMGWFVQVAEAACLLAAVIIGRIV